MVHRSFSITSLLLLLFYWITAGILFFLLFRIAEWLPSAPHFGSQEYVSPDLIHTARQLRYFAFYLTCLMFWLMCRRECLRFLENRHPGQAARYAVTLLQIATAAGTLFLVLQATFLIFTS